MTGKTSRVGKYETLTVQYTLWNTDRPIYTMNIKHWPSNIHYKTLTVQYTLWNTDRPIYTMKHWPSNIHYETLTVQYTLWNTDRPIYTMNIHKQLFQLTIILILIKVRMSISRWFKIVLAPCQLLRNTAICLPLSYRTQQRCQLAVLPVYAKYSW